MEKDRADGVETKDKDTNTDAIRPTRTGTLHGEHYLPQPGQRRASHPVTTRTNPRQAARDTGRPPEAGQASGYTRSDIHKVAVHLVRCSDREVTRAVFLTG